MQIGQRFALPVLAVKANLDAFYADWEILAKLRELQTRRALAKALNDVYLEYFKNDAGRIQLVWPEFIATNLARTIEQTLMLPNISNDEADSIKLLAAAIAEVAVKELQARETELLTHVERAEAARQKELDAENAKRKEELEKTKGMLP